MTPNERSTMSPNDYPRRYLYIAGGFAAGGTLTQLGPHQQIYHPIPTVAPVDLPSVGGLSENRSPGFAVHGRDVQLPPAVEPASADLIEQELFRVGAAHCVVRSIPYANAEAAGSETLLEARGLTLDTLSIDACRLEIRSTHRANERHPEFRFEGTSLTGLRLGGYDVTVTLDLATFDRHPTLESLEQAFLNNPSVGRALSNRFLIDPNSGRFYRNESGYVAGSLVSHVSGLPPGAFLENAYTINYPEFGRIVLGEVFMGAYIRRATMVRVIHSDLDYVTGCSGGSWYP